MPIVAGVAALDLFILGVFSIMFLYWTRPMWMPLMVYLLSEIPIIGAWVASNSVNLINKAFAWILARVDQVLQPAIDFIVRIESRTLGFIDAVLSSIRSTYNALVYLTTLAIPAAIATMTAYVEARIVQINAVIAGASAAATAYVEARIVQINAVIAGAAGGALASAIDAANAIQAWAQLKFTYLEGLIGLNLATAEAAAAQALATAEADAAAAVGIVASADAAALADLRALANQGFLDGAAALAAAEADAKALANALASNTLVQALAATGVVAVGLEAIRELECIKQCNPLGQLGNDLQALDLGIVLAVLLEATTHPKEGAAALESMLGEGGRIAAKEFRQVLGW